MGIAFATVLLWQLPFGPILLYPFTMLATWFHEMGHGLASMLLGARFEELMIFADGSGYAQSAWSFDAPGLFRALTAAAGLLGPSLAGAALIVASRSRRATRTALVLLGTALLLSTVIWVRSIAGWIVLPAIGMAVLGLAVWGSASAKRLGVELLGVQAAISLGRDIHYLFSSGAMVGGQLQPSDTQAIANEVWLPYWFWGGSITVLIVYVLWRALTYASAPRRQPVG
ncbi:M50 family metallopeptidase [Tsuneonella sp. HG094]